MNTFKFPPWVNRLVPLVLGFTTIFVIYLITIGVYATTPTTINVGYQPDQPVPFSHRTHVDKLKMDCRYCHNTVEDAAYASIPATETCGNCHTGGVNGENPPINSIKSKSKKLDPVRESLETGKSIPWTKVHDLPDFVYFNHSAHVTKGVSCVECHGRIDKMDKVFQAKPLSMAWCLDCHRNPDSRLRPQEFITDLGWKPKGEADELGAKLRKEHNIQPSTNCSTCHR